MKKRRTEIESTITAGDMAREKDGRSANVGSVVNYCSSHSFHVSNYPRCKKVMSSLPFNSRLCKSKTLGKTDDSAEGSPELVLFHTTPSLEYLLLAKTRKRCNSRPRGGAKR